jgi:Lon protease-like protein
MTEIGIFPLGVVLLPGERVPLHIFEERYKELISECLEMEREFGIVLAEGSGVRAVGTTAAVVEVLERFPDGRMDIVVQGRTRFRVDRITEGRSFMTARVEDLEDVDDGDDPTREETARCLTAYRHVVEAADAEPGELDLVAESLAFEIAGRVDFGAELKQDLLETRSERERVVRLTELLEAAADLVRTQRTLKERARGNGHLAT